MASQYPASAPPVGAGSGAPAKGQFDISYLMGLDGILKIAETVLSLIVFICASVQQDFISEGGGWVQFVSITAFMILIVLIVMYVFGFIYNLPHAVPRELILFIFFGVYTLFYFISGIVAAAWASHDDAVAACTFFAFAATLVFGADTYFHFMTWRETNSDIPNPPMSTPGPGVGAGAAATPGVGAPQSGPATISTAQINAQY